MELAASAVAAGLKEMGFSDHSPMSRDDFDDWRMKEGELALYVAKVEEARRQFPQLAIRLALEVDYIPGQEHWIKDLSKRYSWDYFIGSVHYISDSWAIDNPHMVSAWKERDALEVWAAYFDRLTMAAESGLFDIIGHADLCKRFCFYPREDCTGLFRRFLIAAKKQDVAVELNTAGLRKDCREIYPSRTILQMAFETGVAITFGSDAHGPNEVAMNFAEAIQLARSVGYRSSRRFVGRRFTDEAF